MLHEGGVGVFGGEFLVGELCQDDQHALCAGGAPAGLLAKRRTEIRSTVFPEFRILYLSACKASLVQHGQLEGSVGDEVSLLGLIDGFAVGGGVVVAPLVAGEDDGDGTTVGLHHRHRCAQGRHSTRRQAGEDHAEAADETGFHLQSGRKGVDARIDAGLGGCRQREAGIVVVERHLVLSTPGSAVAIDAGEQRACQRPRAAEGAETACAQHLIELERAGG